MHLPFSHKCLHWLAHKRLCPHMFLSRKFFWAFTAAEKKCLGKSRPLLEIPPLKKPSAPFDFVISHLDLKWSWRGTFFSITLSGTHHHLINGLKQFLVNGESTSQIYIWGKHEQLQISHEKSEADLHEENKTLYLQPCASLSLIFSPSFCRLNINQGFKRF